MTAPVRHYATYDARRARMTFAHASFIGGEAYRNPAPSTLSDAECVWTAITQSGDTVSTSETRKRFNSYLVPHPAEDDRSFKARLELASFVNPVEIVVNAYADGATRGVQRQMGALAEYADDIDLRGSTWGEFMEDVARWAAVYGFVAVVVDAPQADDSIVTRADEQRAGVRPYCVCVHPTAIAWVCVDDRGRLLEFAYVDDPYHEDVESSAARTTRQITLRIYHRGRIDDAGNEIPAGWEVVRGNVRTTDSLLSQRGAISDVVSHGELPKTIAGRLPVEFAFYRRDTSSRYPLGLSLVDNACDIARTIYNRRSYELQIQREAGFPTLAVPAKASQGKLPLGTKITIGSAKAIGYDADSGAPQWIQPSSEWARDMRESNLADFQAALRTAGLEMATEAGASSSGEALRIRSRDFEATCARFARNLQRTEMALLDLLALYGGTTNDAEITYPRRFVLPDLSADLERALTLLNPSRMPVEIGPTAKLEAVMQALHSGLVLTDETAQKSREEVTQILAEDEAEIAAQRKVASAQRDKMMASFAAPKPANDAKPVTDEDDDADPPRPAA
jgi:hypothetical protein